MIHIVSLIKNLNKIKSLTSVTIDLRYYFYSQHSLFLLVSFISLSENVFKALELHDYHVLKAEDLQVPSL